MVSSVVDHVRLFGPLMAARQRGRGGNRYRSVVHLVCHVVVVWMIFARVSAAESLTFEHDIRPILRTYCYDCHGAQAKHEGELDLRLVRTMVRGGTSGPALVPGEPAQSWMLERMKQGEMPPSQHRVPAPLIERLESWIAQGAVTARPEPSTLGTGLGITPEERDYWAFRPIVRHSLPAIQGVDRVRTPIDVWLLAAMEPEGLAFAPDVDKVTWLRRVSLDLLGLPPTPEEIDAFLADTRPQAWDDVVERMLASPHYGERWARHWLDVAGYADSEGAERDDVRAWAYPYRDWVIRAIQRDMPFDEFVQWQLAGDELVPAPTSNLTADQIEKLTATGFLRMAADGTDAKNDEDSRQQVIVDTLKIVSSSLLGLSVGCAQCHDHRYDPISQVDYYRLRAVFEPALNCQSWVTPSGRHVSLATDEQRAQAAAIEAEAQGKETDRARQQEAFMESALQGELAKHPEPVRELLALAYRTPNDKRTAEQQRLLAEYPSVANLSPGVLYQYLPQAAEALKKIDQEIAAIRARKPVEPFVRVLLEPADREPPITRLLYRGDYRQPQQPVAPGGLAIASPDDSPFMIPDDNPALPTTGRRLAFARWLTSGRHPLLARVWANRVWLHHFGQGLVATPDEFGKLGTMPSHPELLDWIADEFMAQGWSLKHLHRIIVLSTAYRQQSIASTLAQQRDNTNRWYSHFPVHRLEAEVIRDAMLSVSGQLDTTTFGAPVAVPADDTGQMVTTGERQRRSIYLQVRRTQPVAMLKAFDAPTMEVNCGRRESSTVATQSLILMNGNFTWQAARRLAEQMELRAAESLDDRLTWGWRQILSRSPNAEELQLARQFYLEQLELLTARRHESPSRRALSDFAQALMISNEFLYVE